MTARMEVFPVSIVPRDESAADYVTRAGVTKRCPTTTTWFADWFLARRGTALHHATDIFGPRGSLVLAPESGRVVRSTNPSGPTPKGGHSLYISTGARLYYLAHLDAPPLVMQGAHVEAGQVVGKLGRSGNAATACPHLHLQAWSLPSRQPRNLYAELVALDPTRAGRRHRLPALNSQPMQVH